METCLECEHVYALLGTRDPKNELAFLHEFSVSELTDKSMTGQDGGDAGSRTPVLRVGLQRSTCLD